jgi:cytochrome P450
MRFPGSDVVVTCAPAIIDTVLRERPTHGLFNAEGEDWRRLRRVAMRGLNAKYLRGSFTTITRSATQLQERWRAAAGRRVDVVDELLRYTLEVSVALTMGYNLNPADDTEHDGLHRQLSQLFQALGRRLTSPVSYWRYVRLPADRRLDAAVRKAGVLILDRYADAKRHMINGNEPTDFLTALAKADVDGHDPLNDADVVGNVLTMIVAGEDTTAAATSWVMHFLATHPGAQQQVRAEATDILGPSGSITDPSALSRLRYAEAVVNEAIRLRPPTPYVVMEPIADTTVTDGTTQVRINAGTPIFLLLTHGSADDTSRFPDPESFRPQRWLTADTAAPAKAQPYLPFGNGPRFCPGRNLALMEAMLIAATTCHAFVLLTETGHMPQLESPKRLVPAVWDFADTHARNHPTR